MQTCSTCPLARQIEDDRYACSASHNHHNPVVRGHWSATQDCTWEIEEYHAYHAAIAHQNLQESEVKSDSTIDNKSSCHAIAARQLDTPTTDFSANSDFSAFSVNRLRRDQLLAIVKADPKFEARRLRWSGRAIPKHAIWDYLCELKGWKPLEVQPTISPDWVKVASQSQMGNWYRTSVAHQACDCKKHQHDRDRDKKCAHLQAAENFQWQQKYRESGFSVKGENGSYRIHSNNKFVADLKNYFKDEWSVYPNGKDPITYSSPFEALEYLESLVSFGWQIG